MKMRGLGVEVDGVMVALLQYADDLAILAESEQDLQDMLNVLHEWTQEFDIHVCHHVLKLKWYTSEKAPVYLVHKQYSHWVMRC